MTLKQLGNTNLHTAPIVFGGNVFGWTLDEKESFRILDGFIEAGFNTIDTANSYSHWAPGNKGGESETIIGNWLGSRGNREEINLITKVGSNVGHEGRNVSKSHILKEVENSLKRLKTDVIDLYFTHWDDPSTPVEETLEAYQQLIKAGKVRYIGASNLSLDRLKESLEASKRNGLPKYEVLQPEYNLYDRENFEAGASSICQNEGMGVITYYSLASGFLTGKYRSEKDFSKSVRGSGVNKYLDERGKRILAALDDISLKRKVSQSAVALAWLINSPLVTAPIASATKPAHIKAFTEAASLDLSEADIEILERASKK